MFNICCGRSLGDILKSFALLDLLFDNINVAVVFTSCVYPDWLPESYYKATKVYTLQHTFENATAPIIHKPQEDPRNNPPPQGDIKSIHINFVFFQTNFMTLYCHTGESHFILFLTSIGFLICFICTISLFYWLWTGARQVRITNNWFLDGVFIFVFIL